MRYLLLTFIFITSAEAAFSQGDEALKYLINNSQLKHSFIGICLYNPQKDEVVYQYNADRYFTPASNVKLYSFYTGLRYLGDSTTGIQYQEYYDTLYIRGTGDPSFLHPDFKKQPAFDFLNKSRLPIALVRTEYKNKIYGPGWAWDDFNGEYQPERSAFPIYGNVAWFSMKNKLLHVMPSFFSSQEKLVFDPAIPVYGFKVKRELRHNLFHYNISQLSTSRIQQVPFITFRGKVLISLLQDTLHKKIYRSVTRLPENNWKTIANVPVDSLFKNMMYRSDNFFAEQTDQMVSMKLFNKIDSKKVIEYVLEHDLKDLPDKPVWVDGSGLSRYNLFSPADMVTVLRHLYSQFPHKRIFDMLPTGGKGTLSYWFRDMAGSVFAKTGSLHNNVTLSGYLITQKGHTYIFSIMINHCMGSLNVGRKAMERFLRAVWVHY